MKQLKNLATTITALSLLTLSLPSRVSAQITNPATGNLGDNIEDAESGALFLGYFITLWQAIIVVGGLTVIVFFIWGAYSWISAGGDASKIQKGRDRILQSIIGMIILAGSFIIIGAISRIFFGDNFDLLRFTIPDPNATGPAAPPPPRP
jgi:hypothetical protein